MDFDLIIFLLIFLVPVLRRLFEKKRPDPADMEASPEPLPRAERDPIAEALRQMREAFGEPAPAPSAPLPQNPPPVTARPTEFRALGEFEHEAHGFGRENPLSEEVFEQRPAFSTRGSTDRIRRDALEEIDLTTPLEVKAPTDSSSSGLAHRLRDRQSARDAFVLKEILGPPRSRRRF